MVKNFAGAYATPASKKSLMVECFSAQAMTPRSQRELDFLAGLWID
jgi:hypothetical protein